MSKEHRNNIDEILASITPPDYVTRTPRKLSDLNVWKALELRAFLLYSGPIVLNNHLNVAHYDHFLLFSRSIYLLSKEEITATELNLADTLLHIFVIDVEKLYGRNKCSYNIHQLKHITSHVRMWGPLWAWSAFSSEDHNGELIRMAHGTKNVDVELSNTIEIIHAHQSIKYLMNQNKQKVGHEWHTYGPPITGKIDDSDLQEILHSTGLTKQQFLELKIFIFSRCSVNNEIYTSQLYSRQKKRSNFHVQWTKDNIIYFGGIKYFLTIEEKIYAIVRQAIASGNKSKELKNSKL